MREQIPQGSGTGQLVLARRMLHELNPFEYKTHQNPKIQIQISLQKPQHSACYAIRVKVRKHPDAVSSDTIRSQVRYPIRFHSTLPTIRTMEREREGLCATSPQNVGSTCQDGCPRLKNQRVLRLSETMRTPEGCLREDQVRNVSHRPDDFTVHRAEEARCISGSGCCQRYTF